MAKLALILNAKQGWDAEHSRPADRTAVGHYLRFVATVATLRLVDAEPILTDEGFIRLEWEREGIDHVAEIGPDSLWLCSLGASPTGKDDDSVEVDHYDEGRLTKFFTTGVLRDH